MTTDPVLAPDATPDAQIELQRSVANVVGQKLKVRKISQAELARRVGVSRPYITQLLQGRYNLSLGSLQQIAEALGYRVVISFQRVRNDAPKP